MKVQLIRTMETSFLVKVRTIRHSLCLSPITYLLHNLLCVAQAKVARKNKFINLNHVYDWVNFKTLPSKKLYICQIRNRAIWIHRYTHLIGKIISQLAFKFYRSAWWLDNQNLNPSETKVIWKSYRQSVLWPLLKLMRWIYQSHIKTISSGWYGKLLHLCAWIVASLVHWMITVISLQQYNQSIVYRLVKTNLI